MKDSGGAYEQVLHRVAASGWIPPACKRSVIHLSTDAVAQENAYGMSTAINRRRICRGYHRIMEDVMHRVRWTCFVGVATFRIHADMFRLLRKCSAREWPQCPRHGLRNVRFARQVSGHGLGAACELAALAHEGSRSAYRVLNLSEAWRRAEILQGKG